MQSRGNPLESAEILAVMHKQCRSVGVCLVAMLRHRVGGRGDQPFNILFELFVLLSGAALPAAAEDGGQQQQQGHHRSAHTAAYEGLLKTGAGVNNFILSQMCWNKASYS